MKNRTPLSHVLLSSLLGISMMACGDDGQENISEATSSGGASLEGRTSVSSTGGHSTGGSTDAGETNTGGADVGATNTGGVDAGATNTGGADAGAPNTGGADAGATNTGGADAGATNTGGADTGGSNTGGSNTGGSSENDEGSCSTTATTGLGVGELVPDMQVQHCDGTQVQLLDLICGNEITQIYSYAAWCPGCQSFTETSGNELYNQYQENGFAQVIVLSATEDFGDPTEADCLALQDLHDGLVVFDSSGVLTSETLDLKVNGGTALVDGEGLWVTAPTGKDAENEDSGFMEVFTELMNIWGV